jgi:type VI protein secretion system component Hcp
MDAESPKLLEHLQNNSVIPDAKLVLTAGGTIDLKNARVGSVVQSAGAARPVETVTLQFEDLDYEVGGQPAGEEKDANGWFEADGTKSGKWSSPAINWSWEMTTPHAGSGGGATGRRRLEEFQITLPAGGPAAAHALSALDTNEVLKTAKLIPKSGPHFDLSDANVSDIQLAVDDQQRAIATIKMVYRSISEEAGNRAATDDWSGANT